MDRSGKKVTFITGSLADGGSERVISILANTCAKMGADVSVIVLREKTYVYALSDKVKVFQIKSKGSRNLTLRRIAKLHELIKYHDTGTLISFMPIISIYTLIANIGVRRNIILSERADPNISIFVKNTSMKDRIANLVMRKLGFFGFSDFVVFQTPDAQKWYSKRIQKKSCIIPNPLDTDHLPKRFCGEREKRIVAAGRFSEEKNFPMLLNAFSAFHKQFPEYTLELYGEGKLRNTYEKLSVELGIQDSIKMPGFVNDLAERICNAAMYVSTSNHEGISNSMLEALGMGIPTIVTDCPVGGARMYVKTDENGILIPMGNVDSLVKAMIKIAEDDEYSKRLSKNAVSIRDELSAEKICKKWLELL